MPTSLVVLASPIGCSQPHDDVGNQPEETSARANAKLLFVRETRDIAFDGDTLTMNGVQSVLEGG